MTKTNKHLCIDWGNSRVKVALFEGDHIIEHFYLEPGNATSEILKILDQYQPDASILCCVAKLPETLIQNLKQRERFIMLDDRTPLPIINAYNTINSLGMDRIAMSVGMQQLFPGKNNLVVCLGTAITYNFTQKSGIFRGGNISPGMKMRFKSLHEFTEKLPSVDENGEVLLLGYDTASCIRSGVVLGIAAEVDGMLNNYRAQYPDFNAVLTGGDSDLFAGRLKNKIFADPHILLKGLNSILNHNAR